MYSRRAKGVEKRVGVVEMKMEEEEEEEARRGGKKMIKIFFLSMTAPHIKKEEETIQ